MEGLKYFNIPKYPKAFLKTKLGKTCLFYSILPYLCECDSSRKKEKNSRFNKCTAFCSQKKIEMLINRIYRKKNEKKLEESQSNNLEEELMISCLKQAIPYMVLTKENKLTKYEMALKEELIFFKGYSKYKDKYSQRDIILNLMKRMPSFLKEFFVAAECKKGIEKEKKYSLKDAAEIQFPDDKNADFLYNKNLMPLMPLVYSLFYCLKDENPIHFYVLRKNQKGKTKRFVQFDNIKSSSVEKLNEWIADGNLSINGKQKHLPYNEEDGKTNKKDFFFKNKTILSQNFDTVISNTIKIIRELKEYGYENNKQTYFSFKKYFNINAKVCNP